MQRGPRSRFASENLSLSRDILPPANSRVLENNCSDSMVHMTAGSAHMDDSFTLRNLPCHSLRCRRSIQRSGKGDPDIGNHALESGSSGGHDIHSVAYKAMLGSRSIRGAQPDPEWTQQGRLGVIGISPRVRGRRAISLGPGNPGRPWVQFLQVLLPLAPLGRPKRSSGTSNGSTSRGS